MVTDLSSCTILPYRTSIINQMEGKMEGNFTVYPIAAVYMDLRRAKMGSFGAIGFDNCWWYSSWKDGSLLTSRTCAVSYIYLQMKKELVGGTKSHLTRCSHLPPTPLSLATAPRSASFKCLAESKNIRRQNHTTAWPRWTSWPQREGTEKQELRLLPQEAPLQRPSTRLSRWARRHTKLPVGTKHRRWVLLPHHRLWEPCELTHRALQTLGAWVWKKNEKGLHWDLQRGSCWVWNLATVWKDSVRRRH